MGPPTHSISFIIIILLLLWLLLWLLLPSIQPASIDWILISVSAFQASYYYIFILICLFLIMNRYGFNRVLWLIHLLMILLLVLDGFCGYFGGWVANAGLPSRLSSSQLGPGAASTAQASATTAHSDPTAPYPQGKTNIGIDPPVDRCVIASLTLWFDFTTFWSFPRRSNMTAAFSFAFLNLQLRMDLTECDGSAELTTLQYKPT